MITPVLMLSFCYYRPAFRGKLFPVEVDFAARRHYCSICFLCNVYEGKAIWNVFIDSLFVNALPVPMLETGFFKIGFPLGFIGVFVPEGSQDGVPTWT